MIQRALKQAGLVYARIERWGDEPSQVRFEEESLGQASSKEEVLSYLRTQVFRFRCSRNTFARTCKV